MQFATGCTAECCRLQWNASAGGQAGRQRSWLLEGRCSSPLTHLCSTDSAVLCPPGVPFNHLRALYYSVLSRSACTCFAEPSALDSCTAQGFVFSVFTLTIVTFWGAFFVRVDLRKMLLRASRRSSSFARLLWHQRCEDAPTAFFRWWCDTSGQNRFPPNYLNNIWAQERRRKRTSILEGGRP